MYFQIIGAKVSINIIDVTIVIVKVIHERIKIFKSLFSKI